MSTLGVLGQKEGPDVSPKEPSDRQILSVFFAFFVSNHILQPQHHKSMSPLGVLGRKEGPDVSPKEPSDHSIILRFVDFAKA